MSTVIKKVPINTKHFRQFAYELWSNGKLIATCTNVNTANQLMMLELKKVRV